MITEFEIISMQSSLRDLHIHFGLPLWKGICSLAFLYGSDFHHCTLS